MNWYKKAIVSAVAVLAIGGGIATLETSSATATDPPYTYYAYNSHDLVATSGTGYIYCDTGDVALGGGAVYTNAPAGTYLDSAPAGTSGWMATVQAPDSTSRYLNVFVKCAHLN